MRAFLKADLALASSALVSASRDWMVRSSSVSCALESVMVGRVLVLGVLMAGAALAVFNPSERARSADPATFPTLLIISLRKRSSSLLFSGEEAKRGVGADDDDARVDRFNGVLGANDVHNRVVVANRRGSVLLRNFMLFGCIG